MEQNDSLGKLFKRIGGLIEKTPIGDLDALLSGEAELLIVRKGKRQPKENHALGASNGRDLASMILDLRSLASRDEGLRLLGKAELSKKDLEKMARIMDLPVYREDNAERLRQRIIEQSIGARLNSEAIRGQ